MFLSIILKNIYVQVMLHGSICCKIFADFYEVIKNTFYILMPIFQGEQWLDWSHFGFLNCPYVFFFFLEKC